MPGSACRPKMRETPSSAPASMAIRAPPGMISSAGWKISRTRPGSRSATPARARPAPSRAAACTSWPHACATPWTVLAQGSSVWSSTGRASRSARSATSGPSPEPMSTIRPLRGSGVGTRPSWSSRLAMTEVVRSSAQESSGWAWRSRRTSISWSDCASTPASTDWSRPGWSIGAAEVTTDKSIGPVSRPVRGPSAGADLGEAEHEARGQHPVAREQARLVDAGGSPGHEGAAEPHPVAGLQVGQRAVDVRVRVDQRVVLGVLRLACPGAQVDSVGHRELHLPLLAAENGADLADRADPVLDRPALREQRTHGARPVASGRHQRDVVAVLDRRLAVLDGGEEVALLLRLPRRRPRVGDHRDHDDHHEHAGSDQPQAPVVEAHAQAGLDLLAPPRRLRVGLAAPWHPGAVAEVTVDTLTDRNRRPLVVRFARRGLAHDRQYGARATRSPGSSQGRFGRVRLPLTRFSPRRTPRSGGQRRAGRSARRPAAGVVCRPGSP